MTIRHLTIFVAVADHGSMSAAASYLYLSQPTISQAIRELEKHYNGLLFERLGRKLYLKERGRLLLPQARNLIRQFQQIEELMLNQGQSSTLKLGSTITVGTCLTPFLIPKLQKLCPEVRVHSYVSNTKDIEQKLLRSELDVGIVEGEVLSSDLSVLPIIDDCLVLAVGKYHPFYQKNYIQVQDLAEESFAMREQGSGTRQLFEEYITRHQISVQTVWESNCPRTLLNAVLYDQVLSVMSLRLMTHEIRHNTIRVFYNKNGEWNRKFKLVYHKNKFLTPAIYALEKLLHTYKNIKLPENMGILE
mgnify:FL=1